MTSTLPSLSRQTAEEVEGILANLTLALLPNPGIGGGFQSDLTPELRDRLIKEIRISLRLKAGDESPKAKARIYDYLAREIERTALARVNINDVKTRLGDRGDLAPPLYKIEFMEAFTDIHERRGVERRDVEHTLKSPDSVEHLRPDRLGIDTAKATSLYLKEFKNSYRPSNTYSLLVFCQRVGYVQRVGQAWMIFHSDVDLTRAQTPLDVLKAFVNEYGFEIKVGDKIGRFFWHERVPVPPGKETMFLQIARPDPSIDMSVRFEHEPIINNVMQIVYAYGVNYTAYDADLIRHGIKIKSDHRNQNLASRQE